MTRYTVVVTDHDFDDLAIERSVLGDIAELRELSADAGDVALRDERLSEVDGVINLRAELDASAIAAMDDCRVIARYGIGVDNIDVGAATERGIYVTNVPDYCIEEVSSHAITLILALSRRIPAYDRSVGAGAWDREVGMPIHRFSTQTVGVVGFGAIGRAVGAKAAALGATVLASDPFLEPSDIEKREATLVEFEELLENSDYVTVHSPLTEDTRGMFDEEAFDRMKRGARFVNVARGPIVDHDALLAALENDEIAGAGLDVFPEEPPAPGDPLRTHENVVATPHVAWYSEEANEERRRSAAETVFTVLSGSEPENAVNDIE